VDRTGASEAHEVGCGEGELTRRLASHGLSVRGTDASAAVIAEARARAVREGAPAEFRVVELEELEPAVDAAQLIVCCEVMEHLPDPQAALSVVASLASPWAIVSVPREPLWRALNIARLRYLGSLGNTPGHLNHWSRPGFIRFLEPSFEVVDVRAPTPWTMALCRSG
jgi:2-polyprenyl-3-methyl-5-hydroxy-6-metoxy-1,4-benzoquinol methylase